MRIDGNVNGIATLNYQGHVYVDTGETPCPLPGAEGGVVFTRTENDVPAWWWRGHLYVYDERQSVNIPILNEWAKRKEPA